jgi:hypothetical protein
MISVLGIAPSLMVAEWARTTGDPLAWWAVQCSAVQCSAVQCRRPISMVGRVVLARVRTPSAFWLLFSGRNTRKVRINLYNKLVK